MPATVIDFTSSDLHAAPSPPLRVSRSHRVYTRRLWTDAWQLDPYLHAHEISWGEAPAMPTATFWWDYGRIRQRDQADVATVDKRQLKGWWVKIELDTDLVRSIEAPTLGEDRIWVGRIKIEEDQQWGEVRIKRPLAGGGGDFRVRVASGRQTWHAVGMEDVLAEYEHQLAYWINGDVSEVGIDEDNPYVTRRPIAFNANGQPNRSVDKGTDAYVFESGLNTAEEGEPQFWSTFSIVEHLLAWHTPRNNAGEVVVPFRLKPGASVIPDWDRPEIPTERQTTLSLLQRLLDRRRLLSWRLEYNADENRLELATSTLTAKEITFPEIDGAAALPANERLREWSLESDQLSEIAIKETLEAAHQTIALGPPIVAVGTLTIDSSQLESAWTNQQLSSITEGYNVGASALNLAYATAGPRDRERLNAIARARLEDVFTRFRLVDIWDGTCTDFQEGGVGQMVPEGDEFPPWPGHVEFLPDLPLLEGVDYSGERIKEGIYTVEGREDFLRPLVLLKKPNADDIYRPAERTGETADIEDLDEDEAEELRLSCHVHVRGRNLFIKPMNQPAHIIGGDDFTPLTEDKVTGIFDYRELVATLAIAGERIRGVQPADDDLPPATEAVRRKYVDAGERYKHAFVARGTVVGVNASGELITTAGGTIPATTHFDYAPKQLKAIARLAHGWYGESHAVATLRTKRMLAPEDLALGDFITHTGHAAAADPSSPHRRAINGIVTQIRVTIPKPPPDAPEVPQMEVTVWSGELDAMRVVPTNPPSRSVSAVPASGGSPAGDAIDARTVYLPDGTTIGDTFGGF